MRFLEDFFYKVFSNLSAIFKGKKLLWQIGAVLLTYFIVSSGFDWFYYLFTRGEVLQGILFPAIIIGGLLPMILPFVVYFFGLAKRSEKIINAGAALGQSALLGYIVSTVYKAFTGRIPPSFGGIGSITDISHGFQFGFLKGGVFWGWPSSHTTVAFAMAGAMLAMLPKNRTVKIISVLYALYIGIAVSATIHWFSEFAAGAIFGSIIGYSVGESFRERSALNARL